MTLLWFAVVFSLIVALVAFASARRVKHRLDTLSQSYWELR
jgi:hypothetical protein